MEKTPQYFYEKMMNCPRYLKAGFLSSVVFGIIAHMYVMTNLCPQPDVYSALFGYGAGYTSGRWGLALLGDFVHVIFGNYSMPWLNGMLSVLFLALSSLCVIEVLDIRNEADSILISAVMVTFPSVIGIFTFIFTTPYYCFSVFLMCLSVYSIKKYGSGGVVCGILLQAFSLGIYQAYLGVAASLLLVLLIIDALCPGKEWKTVFVRAWKYLGILLAGVALYMVLNRAALLLTHHSLSSYKGIDNMGKLKLSQIPVLLYRVYLDFFAIGIKDRVGISPYVTIRISYLVILLFTAYFGIQIIKLAKLRNGIKSAVLVSLFLILFPCGVNIIYIMCPDGVHSLMRYSHTMVYVAFIAILEKYKQDILPKKLAAPAEWVILSAFIATIGSFCYQANEAYLCLQQNYVRGQNYYQTIVTQIKTTEGYEENMPVAFVGEITDSTFTMGEEFKNLEELTGINLGLKVVDFYSRNNLIKYFCGFNPQYITNTTEIEQSPKYKQMPCYPSQGSVDIIDGVVVVKFKR